MVSTSKVPFHVRTPSVPAGIELLDATRHIVASGVGEIHEDVPAGLYRLRVSTGAHADEKVIAVDEPGYEDLALPTRVLSAAPVLGTRASHEFHHYGLSELLRAGPNPSVGHDAGIVVFARNLATDDMPAYDARIKDYVPIEQLSLWQLDPMALRYASHIMDGHAAMRRDDQGWAGLFAEVDPGSYALRWDRPRAHPPGLWRNPNRVIDQSIIVVPGWITFVFVGNRPETGLMRVNASLQMGRFDDRVMAWEMSERAALASEVVLAGLRRGEALVGNETMDLLLHSKFGNPMLGILGAHALLSAPILRTKMLRAVVRNLEGLLGEDHPDFRALCVRARARGFDEVSDGEVIAPPMFHASYRALIEADPDQPGLLAEGSAAERLAPRLRSEAPWTTWVPVQERRVDSVEAAQVEGATRIAVSAYLPKRRVRGAGARILNEDLARALTSPEVGRIAQWLDYARGTSIDPNDLQPREIARRVGLPVATTRRALAWLKDAASGADTEPDKAPADKFG